MRPLRLEFQAFGSYPGKEVIDFGALGGRGLFAVTGPTGAGKTTVFDAMVYALYGVLPGGRSVDGDPRSHHADPAIETYTTLEFEVDEQRYVVRRTPKRERPKRSGTGTTVQPATALLVRIVGETSEPLATQQRECNQLCEALVGLDARQFQRVVLLPQGKFTDFLIATDEDRERLLRQLFGGELFELATRWLKDHMLELEQQVEGVDHEVRRLRANALDRLQVAHEAWADTEFARAALEEASDGDVRMAIEVLRPVREARHADVAELQVAATVAAEQRAVAEAAAKQYDDAATAAATIATLEAGRDEVDALRGAVEASRKARPVGVLATRAEHLEAEAVAAAEALAAVYARVEAAFEQLGRPVPALEPAAVAAAVEAADAHYTRQRQLWQAKEAAQVESVTAEAAHSRAVAAHQRFAEHVAELHAAVAELHAGIESLEPVASAAPAMVVERDAARRRLADRSALEVATQQLATAAERENVTKQACLDAMSRFVASQAPRLAATLVVDEACPVCGALEHPAPAVSRTGEVVDHDEVEAAQVAWRAAGDTLATIATRIEQLRTVLGSEATSPIAEFEAALAVVEQRLAEATEAVGALARSRATLAAQQAELATADQRERELSTAVTATQSTAMARREEADRLALAAEGIDGDALELGTWVTHQLATVVEPLPSLAHTATVAATQQVDAGAALAEALGASGFESVSEARRHALPEREEVAAAERVSEWQAAWATTTQRLQTLREQGIPESRPDVGAVSAAAERAAEAAHRAARQFASADDALSAAGSELDRAAEVALGSAALRLEHETARVVFKTCNGEAGMRVKLERWVLAGELERVTRAANAHLARMTNHRYRLARDAQSKGGLTLEVFDAHTGRSRSTASLSGGEQFQASLSLALGLADVVSHGGTASGKQFEALFVDEGFGALDADSLDDAIDALAQLHAAGRMVGAITHVEAMKQRLHVGIEVHTLADGRGSTLKVNP